MGRAAELEDRRPANPDPSRRACFVLRGPGSSSRAPIRLSELWPVPRGPDTSCGPDSSFGALVRQGGALTWPARSRFLLRGPDLSQWALIYPLGRWSVPWIPGTSQGAWSISRRPDPSRGALIRHAGPYSSCGALVRPHPARPWRISRCPNLSCGVLVGHTGRRTWFVLRSPDSSSGPLFVSRGPIPSRGALIRLSGPWFVLRAMIRSAVPWLVLRALIRPAGPDPFWEAQIHH